MNNFPTNYSYSTAHALPPTASALANPVPIDRVSNLAVDNLNHNRLNAYGMSGTGAGTASKGWW